MYLLLQGQTIDDIPMGVIEDAAQLCKANSIQVRMWDEGDLHSLSSFFYCNR